MVQDTRLLEAVYKAAVGTHGHLGHDVVEGDEMPDVDGGLVLESIAGGGRVEVDDVNGATGHAEMGGERGAQR